MKVIWYQLEFGKHLLWWRDWSILHLTTSSCKLRNTCKCHTIPHCAGCHQPMTYIPPHADHNTQSWQDEVLMLIITQSWQDEVYLNGLMQPSIGTHGHKLVMWLNEQSREYWENGLAMAWSFVLWLMGVVNRTQQQRTHSNCSCRLSAG